MANGVRVLVASFVLVSCGGTGDTLFVKGNANGGGTDGGGAQAGTSSGGSGGNSSGMGGANAGGSSASGGQVSTGGGNSQGGGTSSGGATSADGSAGGSDGGTVDGSTDASAGGSNGGAAGAGGRGTGGRNGSGGRSGAGGVGSGGKGGMPADGGALEPTPGVISCAGSPCTIAGTPTNVCCQGGLTPACLPSFPGCVQFGISYSCDDAADCSSGNICCGSTLGASCAKSCSGNQFQLCRTNAECKAGECRPVTTAREYSACQ